jgi:uncharacterized protein HemY
MHMNPMVHNLESMLAAGKDGALLRYTLGKAYADEEQMAVAREHLRKATALDAEYSVAWKQLGKVELALGDAQAARAAWQQGLSCARPRAMPRSSRSCRCFCGAWTSRLPALELSKNS